MLKILFAIAVMYFVAPIFSQNTSSHDASQTSSYFHSIQSSETFQALGTKTKTEEPKATEKKKSAPSPSPLVMAAINGQHCSMHSVVGILMPREKVRMITMLFQIDASLRESLA